MMVAGRRVYAGEEILARSSTYHASLLVGEPRLLFVKQLEQPLTLPLRKDHVLKLHCLAQ